MVLYLPETLGTKLPDTIEEAVAQAGAAAGQHVTSGSSDSLDVGYGKCPEFVCVDGLIVSKDNGWQDSDSGHEQSLSMSHQGTLSTLRYLIHCYTDTQSVHQSEQELQFVNLTLVNSFTVELSDGWWNVATLTPT